ncbi:MAG: hypothetical protein UY31_C0010G0002 [Candidatus Wolfebacteria bacterium GW2011_GWE1_48_7]|uniref:POTRA domain-containing protein n=2 Tax=Candidatus Wolfeibacteriota TaxID=1752735 RepID=A0A0G1WJE8_9BACT|nr:MAG: hypothetical protein UX70_C0001G0486 [Candidatus Wolfebacteria bacterium GW2011_GWB1_47_1]KKU37154.1 MAG: hypothetical protein UX49_C0001G0024 [Candidatus Wolfebacteria bacterium GW2011_GWC2_46_275]KKU42686.1 MAG: hypothetical protein UX58_C0001G0118 [Candidatus Wolfebacteria bacterium GW2011_GWB2_46_69]KKU54579.1 MAG: hypothetical protein UX76_C0001G0038 [Candidatus Wolfebacteria bacterium GW2011_GWC1_47_103]KKU59963.1 MAG: hypothetical protein UX83_C0001G0038 [Candidatus Wolfebacteria
MNIRRPSDIRKKQNKRDSKKKYIIAGGSAVFLLLVVGSVFGIRQTSLFRIDSVFVEGIPEAYGVQVRRDLESFSRDHSLVFRFLGSGNMIAWDGTPSAFLDANPQFRDVRILKDYMRKSVTIIVDGREKFGVWCHDPARSTLMPIEEGAASTTTNNEEYEEEEPDDTCYWFDRDGVLFARAPQVKSELFNRVYDSTGRSIGLREKILPDRLFVNLAKIFKLMEMAQINTKTVFVRDLALEEVDTDSVSDPRIIFSLRNDPLFALSAIDALKQSGEWSGLHYANFTVENRASYK